MRVPRSARLVLLLALPACRGVAEVRRGPPLAMLALPFVAAGREWVLALPAGFAPQSSVEADASGLLGRSTWAWSPDRSGIEGRLEIVRFSSGLSWLFFDFEIPQGPSRPLDFDLGGGGGAPHFDLSSDGPVTRIFEVRGEREGTRLWVAASPVGIALPGLHVVPGYPTGGAGFLHLAHLEAPGRYLWNAAVWSADAPPRFPALLMADAFVTPRWPLRWDAASYLVLGSNFLHADLLNGEPFSRAGLLLAAASLATRQTAEGVWVNAPSAFLERRYGIAGPFVDDRSTAQGAQLLTAAWLRTGAEPFARAATRALDALCRRFVRVPVLKGALVSDYAPYPPSGTAGGTMVAFNHNFSVANAFLYGAAVLGDRRYLECASPILDGIESLGDRLEIPDGEWLYGGEVASPSAYFNFRDASGKVFRQVSKAFPALPGAWRPFAWEVTPPAGASTATLLLYRPSGSIGRVWYDDVRVRSGGSLLAECGFEGPEGWHSWDMGPPVALDPEESHTGRSSVRAGNGLEPQASGAEIGPFAADPSQPLRVEGWALLRESLLTGFGGSCYQDLESVEMEHLQSALTFVGRARVPAWDRLLARHGVWWESRPLRPSNPDCTWTVASSLRLGYFQPKFFGRASTEAFGEVTDVLTRGAEYPLVDLPSVRWAEGGKAGFANLGTTFLYSGIDRIALGSSAVALDPGRTYTYGSLGGLRLLVDGRLLALERPEGRGPVRATIAPRGRPSPVWISRTDAREVESVRIAGRVRRTRPLPGGGRGVLLEGAGDRPIDLEATP